MDTENVEEVVQASAEQGEQVTRTVSPENNEGLSQKGSGNEEALRSELELLKSEIRGLQSKQDKHEAKTSEFFQTLQHLNVELTPEQQTQYRILELERRLEQQTESVKPVNQQAQQTNPDFLRVFQKANVDPNSAEAIRLSQLHSDPLDLYEALQNKGQQSAQNAAAVTQSVGDSAPDVSQEDIRKQLDALRSDRKAMLDPVKRAEMVELASKLNE